MFYGTIIHYYLQGQSPQEHRNMPYDDAMGLLAKSFEDGGSGGGKGGKESGSQKVGPNDDVPNDIRTCVGFFMDRRPLSGRPNHQDQMSFLLNAHIENYLEPGFFLGDFFESD